MIQIFKDKKSQQFGHLNEVKKAQNKSLNNLQFKNDLTDDITDTKNASNMARLF